MKTTVAEAASSEMMPSVVPMVIAAAHEDAPAILPTIIAVSFHNMCDSIWL